MTDPVIPVERVEHGTFRTILEPLEARERAIGNRCVLLIEGERKTVAALLQRTDELAQQILACEAIHEHPHPHAMCQLDRATWRSVTVRWRSLDIARSGKIGDEAPGNWGTGFHLRATKPGIMRMCPGARAVINGACFGKGVL
jgi:hypothetical protein